MIILNSQAISWIRVNFELHSNDSVVNTSKVSPTQMALHPHKLRLNTLIEYDHDDWTGFDNPTLS